MHFLKGQIARRLVVGFTVLGFLVIGTILASLIALRMIDQDFSRTVVRNDLANQGAKIRAECLELVNEAYRYILPSTSQMDREELRPHMVTHREAIDRLIAETVDMTTPGDLSERTQLARIQEYVVNLTLQINRLVETYDHERYLGPDTNAELDTLTVEYLPPLISAISTFQEYELSRVRETRDEVLQIMRTTLAAMVVVALLAVSFTAASIVTSINRLILPLNKLRSGVIALRTEFSQGEPTSPEPVPVGLPAAETLQHLLPVDQKDEIGMLAETLNSMSSQLSRTLLGMEQSLKELRQAQQEQKISEEHYRSLFNGIPIGLYRTSREGEIIAANPALVEMLHYPDLATLLSGSSLGFYADPHDRLHWQSVMERYGQTRYFEVQMRCFDGSVIWVRDNSRSVLDEQGQLMYYEGSLEDITSLKQAEESIQRLNTELEQRVIERTAQLQAANKELEAFSYSVSHDLRAPLRAMDGYSRLLFEEYTTTLGDDGKTYLARLREASERMGSLIDALLMLSRITRRELQRTQVDLSDIVRMVCAELKINHPERNVDMRIADQVYATADANLIRIVMENLVGNAWKFTAKHPQACIEFGAAHDSSGQTVYFLRDDGAGFDMSYVHKLFGAFQRLHAADDFDGTGIGLATVHRIIRRHGGQIWAEGAVERGATFYFTLPE